MAIYSILSVNMIGIRKLHLQTLLLTACDRLVFLFCHVLSPCSRTTSSRDSLFWRLVWGLFDLWDFLLGSVWLVLGSSDFNILHSVSSLLYSLPALNSHLPFTFFSSSSLSLSLSPSLSSWHNWSSIKRKFTDDYWYNFCWSAPRYPHTHDSTNDEYDTTHQTLLRKKERGRNYK